MTQADQPTDIEAYREYDDPAGSEQRFRRALASATGDVALELQTQIARTYSLRGNFDRAHALLDEVERGLAEAGPRALVRYQLERGRTCQSSGEVERGRLLFRAAWQAARQASLEALDEWTARGRPKQIQLARWSLARCLRSMGRFEQALALQRELEAEQRAAGTADGYVLEELAELLSALGRADEARPYFQRAYQALSPDRWLAENEPERLAALRDRD